MTIKSFRIANIRLKNPLVLAPMLDITNLPYRLVCRKAGASLAYTEMINVPAILHENEKTKNMMNTCKEDSPLGLQITGNNEKEFEKLIPFLKKSEFNLMDLNCGCPSERITENESGSCLLNNPQKISKIIKILKKSNLPITAKIRLGFKRNNALEIARAIQKAGADAIAVHARLANQGYDVPADYNQIKRIKKEISIPVIGNGDILNEKKAEEMLRTTDCDAIMIARGAIGDPLIFDRISYYLETGKQKPFSFKDNIKCFQDYLKLSEKHNLAEINLANIKHLGTKFIKNIKGASKLRNELMRIKSFSEIKSFFSNL
ncbi:MAG: tRNA-dihydrouridine synthase family protein [Candidatus Pacearchaeota archaeon]